MQRWEARRMTEWDSNRRVLVLGGVEILNPETGKKTRQDVMIKDGHVRLVAAGDHPDDAVRFDLTGKVVVPGRSSVKLDSIAFVDATHVKAITIIQGEPYILYWLVREDGTWNIGIW